MKRWLLLLAALLGFVSWGPAALAQGVTVNSGTTCPTNLPIGSNMPIPAVQNGICVNITGVTVTASNVTFAASATGGASIYHLAGGTTASTNSTNIKGSAATLYSIKVQNTNATIYYLRLYNTATAPTCSSATGAVASFAIPASAAGTATDLNFGDVGTAFDTGLSFCVTGGGADNDNTNAATGIFITASYK